MGKLLSACTMAFLMFAGAASSQTPNPNIVVMGMSPYQLAQHYGSQGTRTTTTGLSTVGKGSIVYLNAQDLSGGDITSVTWTLLSKPAGSSTVIDSASSVFTTFLVDTTGQYVVQLAITTAGGTSSVSDTITSATYLGVGFMGGGGVGIGDPKCGLCHLTTYQDWSKQIMHPYSREP